MYRIETFIPGALQGGGRCFADHANRSRRSTQFARLRGARALLQEDHEHGKRTMHGEETFHPDTRALLAYGRALAGAGPAPKKGGADQVLERLLVIERMADGRLPIRTFGKELADVFGRDMRDHDFAKLFLAPDLALLNALIEACGEAGEPGVLRVNAETACGRDVGAEVLITPLKIEPALGDRYLGMFQALGGESFLEGRPIQRLRIGSLHPPRAKAPKGVRLVVSNI